MGVVTRKGSDLKNEFIGDSSPRGQMLTEAYVKQMDALSIMPEIYDDAIDRAILEEDLKHIISPRKLNFTRGLVTFSPSGASKCDRELYYKATKAPKDEFPNFPYQARWKRNGSAIHAATQRDLLLSEKHLKNPDYKVVRIKADGSPAWEKNLKMVRPFPGHGFQLFGMMDGVLEYVPDSSKIGFEFKTKSTTITAIGDYKLKTPQSTHIDQIVAYSLVFKLEEFLIVYESLAKDSWNKGNDAKPDLKAFYYKVYQDERDALLEKFAKIAKQVKAKELPAPDLSKCIFCPYKDLCNENLQG